MPRVRGSEMAQRASSRGPAPLRTSSSDSDPLHHRPIPDRSPKLGDRRSPKSEPVNQKKLGTRIAGLESQLEQAQGELKLLKDQLASAEAAKKEAQKELATKPVSSDPGLVHDSRVSPSENLDESQKETDVFEVPIEMISLETKNELIEQDELMTKPATVVPGEPSFEEALAVKNEEIASLKLQLEEKDKQLEAMDQELKQKLNEANVQIASAVAKEAKRKQKLKEVVEESEKSKKNVTELTESLKEVEGRKQALEAEMKRLRVQTEQWRKAADAAAAVLGGAAEMGSLAERCGSMDKHYGGGVFDGYGVVGVGGDEMDDGLANGKRKGSGIRMFGDLWKKKGHK